LELVAPYTVSGGSGAKVGTSLFGVAMMDIASAATGPFAMEGLFKLAKTTSQAWTAGDRLYWDDSGKKLTTDATAGLFVGVCTVAAGSSDATGYCRLNEGAPGLNSGSQGTLADLTDNSGGASADGTIGVITLPTLAGWNGSTDPTAAEATQIITACTESRDAVKELATKLNALLAKLRLAGILT
jgi:predicted RecA/RadA family phage recombinase